MKKTLKIEGLDCPNCARALETEINKLDGVKDAKINFVKSVLTFESEDATLATQKIVDLARVVEPGAKISEEKTQHSNKKLVFDSVILAIGIAIGIVIFFVDMPKWAYWLLYVASALLLGYKTYIKAVLLLFKGIINENLLITISVIGATFVSEHMEGLMVIALYSIGKIFEGLAVGKSRKAIEELAKTQPEYAVVLDENNEEHKVSPQEVAVGSLIVVRPGEKVALDGIVEEGEASIDMQSLTGESVPISSSKGKEVLSGSIVLNGVLKIRTTSSHTESTTTKIMNLVEKASENKSKTETFISKITKWYTLGIVVLAVSVFGIVWAVTHDLDLAVYRGLIFLVISCPCAFAISVPLSYFSGLGNASKHGVLIKGSNHLDTCARINTVAFDKTGTLTTGHFQIEEVRTFDKQKDILFLAALGEQHSIHPLAKAITSACTKKLGNVKDFKEIAGKGVEFSYRNKKYFVGRQSEKLDATTVEVAENGRVIGEIVLSDTIKPTSKSTCKQLESMKISTVLLSGDNPKTVEKVANELGITNSYAQLLPQQKYEWLESHKNGKTAYVGDGLNDAPSLMVSDVGISMGINGSPASVEASDIVLVDDNPEKIVTAIKISKQTRKIVMQNIVLSAVIKVLFLTLGSCGITGMLAAVFADVGVTLLAILNSLRALHYNPKKAS